MVLLMFLFEPKHLNETSRCLDIVLNLVVTHIIHTYSGEINEKQILKPVYLFPGDISD